MSLVVIYDGKRKIVKIPTPNTLVQVLLVEAAQHFDVDPTTAALKHKKTILDASQPFRFCNLSNNAQIDLVVVGGALSAKKQMSRIALAVDGSENVTESFDSNISLGDMIASLIASGKLPSDSLSRSPELIYLRANYSAEALQTTTLASMGLAGQSARLQLRFGSAPSDASSAGSISPVHYSAAPLSPSKAPPTSQVGTLAKDCAEASAVVSAATAMDVVVEDSTIAHVPAHSPEPAATHSPVAVPVAVHESSAGAGQVLKPQQPSPQPSHHSVVTPGTGVVSSIFTPTASAPGPALEHVPPIPPVVPSPSLCMQQLLADNFDAVSTPAVLTLAKYLVNIILYPEEGRYRKISTENKAFVSKVLAAKGALQFLYSVGFTPHGASALVLVPHGHVVDQTSTATAESTTAHSLSAAQLGALSEGWAALQRAMTELEVPMEDRPSTADAGALQAQRERRVLQLQQQAAFDPFKSHIVRAAPQPARLHETVPIDANSSGTSTGGSGKTDGCTTGTGAATMTLSATERQLLELQRKRAELEGRPEDVQRLTEVLFPRPDGSVANMSEYSEEGTNSPVDTYNEDDSRSAPRSVLQKILKRSGEEDNTPLTTQAVRDLQRAQKERVYSRTLIRIKLPDRLCLQGYFHPRHTVADVYAWVYQCLSVSVSVPMSSSESQSEFAAPAVATDVLVAAAVRIFELYTSPPRTVFSPYSNSSGDKRPTGCGLVSPAASAPCNSSQTLTDLKLVPAALIYLAWKNSPESSGLKKGASAAPGQYLLPYLLVSDSAGSKSTEAGAGGGEGRSSSSGGGGNGAGGATAYPAGISLVPSPDGSSGGADSSSARDLLGGPGGGGGRRGIAPGKSSSDFGGGGESKKMSKPKWFK